MDPGRSGRLPALVLAMAKVVSVNVGAQRDVEWFGRVVRTAIWKDPVDGRVAVLGVNLDGDDQADRRVHGGPDKAVYAYSVEDYAWWAEQGDDVGPGTFGENLTTEGVDLSAAVIGERWRIGTVELEVAQPRQPCFKLGIRMGAAEFKDRFAEADRPGAYLRIVTGGDVGSGDAIEVLDRPDHGLTVLDIVHAAADPTPERLEALLAAPAIPESWRQWAARHR
jgi:MOSC domain-containing protein YiiM